MATDPRAPRRPRHYQELLDTASHDLDHVLGNHREDRRARTPLTRALENLAVWADTGYPTSSLGGTGTPTTPALAARIIARLDHPDPRTADRREIVQLVIICHVVAARLRKLVDSATTTKPTAAAATSLAECR